MSKLTQLKNAYKKGSLVKYDFIKKMHSFHQLLFDYSDFIKKTEIGKIVIEDDKVVLMTRNLGIKFLSEAKDLRSPQFEILNFGSYEKKGFSMILRLLKNKAVVFDIGANTGFNTLFIGKSLKQSTIYAFEPIPQTFKLLKKNLNLNNLKNVHLFNFGFSDRKTRLTFYYSPQEPGNTSMQYLNTYEDTIKISAKVTTLDDFMSKRNLNIDLITCDVEGAEYFVFKGGQNTLLEYKPAIYTEMLRKWTAKFSYHPNEIIKFLEKIGYHCFDIKNRKLKRFFKMTDRTVSTNFLFLHGQKHKKLISSLTY